MTTINNGTVTSEDNEMDASEFDARLTALETTAARIHELLELVQERLGAFLSDKTSHSEQVKEARHLTLKMLTEEIRNTIEDDEVSGTVYEDGAEVSLEEVSS